MEILKNFIFMAKQIDPSEFTKNINKNDIIFHATKGINGRIPNMGEHKI
jgi:hypothetical protein